MPTRWFNVDATFRFSAVLKLPDDYEAVTGLDRDHALLSGVDGSEAELVEYEITEVQNDAGKVT
jgi:hypothetical protein